MNAEELCQEATKLGLRLVPKGATLQVFPARLCPPDFADKLRSQKPAIMALLNAQAADLTPDCKPWLYIAQQILAGEFEGADGSTTQSLAIGLRGLKHPLSERALERLRIPGKKPSW